MNLTTLTCAGPNGGGMTLPVDFGSLGAQALYVGRLLDGSGNVAVANRTTWAAGIVIGAALSFPNDSDDYSDELWQVVVSYPGMRPGV